MTAQEKHSLQGGDGLRSFPQGRWRWIRIPSLLGSVAVLYFLAVTHNVDVFKSVGLLLLFAFILGDVVIGCLLWLRAPREFRVEESVLVVVWTGRQERIEFKSLTIWKVPGLLYKGVVILRSGKRWFVVFDDMSGFQEFVNSVKEEMITD